MPRSRRFYRSGGVYEIVIRVQEGLPFAHNKLINFIISSVITQVNRDKKVHICHYVWMRNHPHIILVAKDPFQMAAFYGQLKKNLTDITKRLLGEETLRMWEPRASAIELLDIQTVIDRVSYLYANPAAANQASSISKFTGLSTWREFQDAIVSQDGIKFKIRRNLPWLRLPTIPEIGGGSISLEEQEYIIEKLCNQNKEYFELELEPNRWMSRFGINRIEEILEMNKEILAQLKTKEDRAAQKRTFEPDPERLSAEPLVMSHKPKKKERKIFFLTIIKETALAFLASYSEYCRGAKLAYLYSICLGPPHPWPPGAFRPPMAQVASLLC